MLCFSSRCLFFLFRFGLCLRRRRLGAFLRVADDDKGVIKLGATIAILINDSALVELEGLGAGIDSDGHRLQSKSLLCITDSSLDLLPFFELAEDIVIIVLTILSFTSVRVILLSHDSAFFLELPAVRHPATAAAKSFVMLTEQLFVVLCVGRTVDKLLLRQLNWVTLRLDSKSRFKGSITSEGPARTARVLVFYSCGLSSSVPINSESIGDQSSATASVVTASVATATYS